MESKIAKMLASLFNGEVVSGLSSHDKETTWPTARTPGMPQRHNICSETSRMIFAKFSLEIESSAMILLINERCSCDDSAERFLTLGRIRIKRIGLEGI